MFVVIVIVVKREEVAGCLLSSTADCGGARLRAAIAPVRLHSLDYAVAPRLAILLLMGRAACSLFR